MFQKFAHYLVKLINKPHHVMLVCHTTCIIFRQYSYRLSLNWGGCVCMVRNVNITDIHALSKLIFLTYAQFTWFSWSETQSVNPMVINDVQLNLSNIILANYLSTLCFLGNVCGMFWHQKNFCKYCWYQVLNLSAYSDFQVPQNNYATTFSI